MSKKFSIKIKVEVSPNKLFQNVFVFSETNVPFSVHFFSEIHLNIVNIVYAKGNQEMHIRVPIKRVE